MDDTIDDINLLALKHLVHELPDQPPQAGKCLVKFHRQSDFKRLYTISYLGHPIRYLFSMALPLVPYYKTASEVAVHFYLRENTTIPVARLIAADSSAKNRLGFEWILSEYIAGETAENVWLTMPWKSRFEFVAALAPLLGQMRDHKFDRIGSLYFRGAECQYGRAECNEDGRYTYMVGQLLQPSFHFHRRLFLPGHRGSFGDSSEWMRAEIDFQIRWIETGPAVQTSENRGDFDDEDWDSDFDEMVPEMKELCRRYQDVLPRILNTADSPSSYVLHHHDLSLANIIVDPITFKIEAITGWEMIQVVPEWKASRFPKFLENLNSAEVLTLRCFFDEALGLTRNEISFPGYDSSSAQTRRELEEGVMDLTQHPGSARDWLEWVYTNLIERH